MDENELKELLENAKSNLEKSETRAKALEERLEKAEKLTADQKAEIESMQTKTAEQIDEFKNELADLEQKLATPTTGSGLMTKDQKEQVQHAVKSAIGMFLKGNSDAADALNEENLKAKGQKFSAFIEMQLKTLNLTNTGEGAEAVDEVLSREVIERAREAYPILGEVRTRPMPRDLREEVLISYPSVQEGIENVAGSNISETDTQEYAEVNNRIAKINAKPRITDEAMMGSDLDLYGQLLVLLDDEVGRRLVAQVLFGDGTGKNMRGILSSNRLQLTDGTGESWKPTLAADPADARDPDYYPAFGTGVSGGLPATDVAIVDWLLDLTVKLPTKYLQGAKWYMNRRTMNRLKKVRDANENPIYLNSYMGDGPSLHGYPVVIDDNMPDFTAADAPFIIFGNLREAFSMSPGAIDKMLIDPYTVDGCTVIKLDKEYYEMVGKNDAIIVGAATTNDGVV